jgi:hypothetical protein
MAQPRRNGTGRRRGSVASWSQPGTPFIPFSVETYGRLGEPAICLLGQLGTEAEEAGRKVSKSGFVAAVAFGSLGLGCARAITRCTGHPWACWQGCLDMGSMRALLAPWRRCGSINR